MTLPESETKREPVVAEEVTTVEDALVKVYSSGVVTLVDESGKKKRKMPGESDSRRKLKKRKIIKEKATSAEKKVHLNKSKSQPRSKRHSKVKSKSHKAKKGIVSKVIKKKATRHERKKL